MAFWQGKTEEELDKIDWTEYLGEGADDHIENADEFRRKLVKIFIYNKFSLRKMKMQRKK